MINAKAAAIYAIMAAGGLSGVIAGGSARDSLHGMKPKDYDVILYDSTAGEVVKTLRSLGFSVEGEYEGYGTTERFDYCIKTSMLGVDVDFIGLKTAPSNPQEVIEDFDFDINQAWFDTDGKVNTHKDYPKIGDSIHVIRLSDRSVEYTAARTKKLAERFPQYDWTYALSFSEKTNNDAPI